MGFVVQLSLVACSVEAHKHKLYTILNLNPKRKNTLMSFFQLEILWLFLKWPQHCLWVIFDLTVKITVIESVTDYKNTHSHSHTHTHTHSADWSQTELKHAGAPPPFHDPIHNFWRSKFKQWVSEIESGSFLSQRTGCIYRIWRQQEG